MGCNPPDNDHYCPDGLVTRAQMAAFLMRAFDPELTTSEFLDVPDGAWYIPYVQRIEDLGIDRGSDGYFRPGEPITRLEMAVWLVRAVEWLAEVEPSGDFVDVPTDAPYARSVEGLRLAGITKGCSADPLAYCPDKPVRRDQMATFLMRILRPGS